MIKACKYYNQVWNLILGVWLTSRLVCSVPIMDVEICGDGCRAYYYCASQPGVTEEKYCTPCSQLCGGNVDRMGYICRTLCLDYVEYIYENPIIEEEQTTKQGIMTIVTEISAEKTTYSTSERNYIVPVENDTNTSSLLFVLIGCISVFITAIVIFPIGFIVGRKYATKKPMLPEEEPCLAHDSSNRTFNNNGFSGPSENTSIQDPENTSFGEPSNPTSMQHDQSAESQGENPRKATTQGLNPSAADIPNHICSGSRAHIVHPNEDDSELVSNATYEESTNRDFHSDPAPDLTPSRSQELVKSEQDFREQDRVGRPVKDISSGRSMEKPNQSILSYTGNQGQNPRKIFNNGLPPSSSGNYECLCTGKSKTGIVKPQPRASEDHSQRDDDNTGVKSPSQPDPRPDFETYKCPQFGGQQSSNPQQVTNSSTESTDPENITAIKDRLCGRTNSNLGSEDTKQSLPENTDEVSGHDGHTEGPAHSNMYISRISGVQTASPSFANCQDGADTASPEEFGEAVDAAAQNENISAHLIAGVHSNTPSYSSVALPEPRSLHAHEAHSFEGTHRITLGNRSLQISSLK